MVHLLHKHIKPTRQLLKAFNELPRDPWRMLALKAELIFRPDTLIEDAIHYAFQDSIKNRVGTETPVVAFLQDPTRTQTLRSNYGNTWRRKIRAAGETVADSSMLTGMISGMVSEQEFRGFVNNTFSNELGDGWHLPFATSAVMSSFVQGSMRLKEPIESDDAVLLPIFGVVLDRASIIHAESVEKSARRAAQLVFDAATKAANETKESINAARRAAKKAILHEIKAGRAPAEAASAADTLIVGTHGDGILTYYESQGVTEVVGQVEFTTAGDNRVCPDCESLAGMVFFYPMRAELSPCTWVAGVAGGQNLKVVSE